MKKIIALLLALIMVMGLATVASAADINGNDVSNELDVKATFEKEYVVKSGIAPIETFAFTCEYVDFVDQNGQDATATTYPQITVGTAVFAEDMEVGTYSRDVDVEVGDVANCALGVYTYKISEVDGNIAGVNYNTENVYLKVTVLRDENNDKHYVAAIHYETEDGSKTDKITNSYEAGYIEISKKTTGNMADLTKKFPIKVIFTPEDTDAFMRVLLCQFQNDGIREYTVTEDNRGNVVVTFELADAETATITNIPLGTTYTVEETDLFNYTQVSANGTDGDFTDTGVVTGTFDESAGMEYAEFVNELKSEVDTGIAMDSVPFIVMAVAAVIGLAAFTAKKRVQE